MSENTNPHVLYSSLYSSIATILNELGVKYTFDKSVDCLDISGQEVAAMITSYSDVYRLPQNRFRHVFHLFVSFFSESTFSVDKVAFNFLTKIDSFLVNIYIPIENETIETRTWSAKNVKLKTIQHKTSDNFQQKVVSFDVDTISHRTETRDMMQNLDITRL